MWKWVRWRQGYHLTGGEKKKKNSLLSGLFTQVPLLKSARGLIPEPRGDENEDSEVPTLALSGFVEV